MSARRFAVLVSTLLVLALPAFAAKRRASRSAPAAAAGNSCHTFGLVRAGLSASYLSQAPGGDVTFTITWITDTPTFTQTTQKVTTPQGTTTAETRLDGEVSGQLRGLRHLNVKTSQTVPVLGSITTETDIDFVPTLTQGPAAGWCVGNTWTVPPVTETVVTRTPQGQNTQVITTIGSTGEVLAVGATVSVPAGDFQTVKYRGAIVSGTTVQTAITWVSMQHNVVVRQDTLDDAGNVTSTTRLTAVQ
ncbi:MAG TPA: hypothetical protein VND45_06175 [Thermoanaerobaculia bacterium]|jgi:hypothetical protein|nr:hypothetical protein [Thermoanaerobaculia bacterium]